MPHADIGIIARIVQWFSGEEPGDPPRRKKASVTEVMERAAQAEERLLTVEQATMSMTVGDLPEDERARYEADDDDEDWF